ncbi:MAG: ABC transporter ATP-binding protein/permease [Planctomycetes bacterium]|nr:ABC transporter ATP-binding protein/permease [Planctomycetota bacterium]
MKLSKLVEQVSLNGRVARRFLPDLVPQRWRVAGVLGAGLGSTALELLRPWPLQWIVDYALKPAATSTTDPTRVVLAGAAAYLGISIVRAACDYVATVQTARAQQELTRGLRYRLFSHLVALSPTFHARNKSGDLLVRLMGDVSLVSSMMTETLIELAQRTLLVVGTLAMLFWIDPLLSAALLVIAPVLLLASAYVGRHITSAVRKQRRKEGELADYMYEAIASTPLIQSLGRGSETVRRFARSNRTSARAGLKTARWSARLSSSVEIALGLAVAIALAVGAWRVLGGAYSAGTLIVFVSYVRAIAKPVRAGSRGSERLSKGAACGERVLKVLDQAVQIRSPLAPKPMPERPRELVFDDVHFAYGTSSGNRAALSRFTARFERGEFVGVVGKSGAGKSTFACLALRLFDPDRGAVRIDGVALGEYDVGELRARYGLCMQETTLFGDTLRENLLLGDPEATEEALWRALDDAAASEFVRQLPRGLDTPLGSAGVGLSGGQRRRIALARTLLRRAPILIVDEPFNGLDRAAVERVRATLAKYAEQGIVLVITHDRGDLEHFDRIVFLEAGRVVADGRHDELLRDHALYRATVSDSTEVRP